MITNLKQVEAGTVPGREIEVTTYELMNYRLRGMLEQVARLFLFLLECDSNNSNSKAVPREVADVIQQWKLVIEELDFGVKHNNAPTGSHEYGYQINLPSLKEIQRVRNVKIKAVIAELFNASEVILSSDCAQLQNFIDDTEEKDMRYVMVVRMHKADIDRNMDRWILRNNELTQTIMETL